MNSSPFFVFNTHGVMVLVVLVLVYTLLIQRNKELSAHILLSLTAAILLTAVLKELFLVPRPNMLNGDTVNGGLAYLSSFPSAHAAALFAVATTVTLHDKRLGVIVFMFATLMSIGRVVANVHYPVDIVVGILIGVIIGMFFDSIHFKSLR